MRRTTLIVPLAGLAVLLAGCGDPGSSGTETTTTSATAGPAGPACEPVAGNQLVVLVDDQGLQQVDNIIPAVNAAAAAEHPEILAVLDAVSAALDTPTLIELNKAVDVDRRTSSEVAAEFLAAQGLDSADPVGDGTALTVGAANFSESATLAELYAGALDAAGFDASVETIGNRETYEPALESGDLTVVPEYVGTLAEFLNAKVNGADAEPVASGNLVATVEALETLGAEVGLVFASASEAQDQNAFAVTTAFAEATGVTTLSELAQACPGGVSLGGPPECPERAFCAPGLTEVYGLDVSDFTALDAGGPLTKAALQQGEVALGLVFSSDAALAPSE